MEGLILEAERTGLYIFVTQSVVWGPGRSALPRVCRNAESQPLP